MACLSTAARDRTGFEFEMQFGAGEFDRRPSASSVLYAAQQHDGALEEHQDLRPTPRKTTGDLRPAS